MSVDIVNIIVQSLTTGFGSALGSFAASWLVIKRFEKVMEARKK